MDSVKQLRRDYTTFVKSAHREGIISRQFIHLQALHGADEYPQFVLTVVNQFITLSEGILPKLDLALEQNLVNSEVKSNVHRMKGSSMSVGARKVNDLCIGFQAYYDAGNQEKCLEFLSQIKEEYHLAKDKLQTMLRLQQQILEAGGTIPNLK